MKREDVKNKIPGITDEQLNWIMQENGADINREKSAATALQAQLDNANAQLKTAQDGLKAFEGVDVAGLQEQVTKLKADMKVQAEGFAFDNALNAAIMSKKGRSVKAVRALLDMDDFKLEKRLLSVAISALVLLICPVVCAIALFALRICEEVLRISFFSLSSVSVFKLFGFRPTSFSSLSKTSKSFFIRLIAARCCSI